MFIWKSGSTGQKVFHFFLQKTNISHMLLVYFFTMLYQLWYLFNAEYNEMFTASGGRLQKEADV